MAAEEASLRVWLDRCWFTAAGATAGNTSRCVWGWVDDGGLAGVHSGLLCDPVLSARSMVKAFRIRALPIPHLQNLYKQPSRPPQHTCTHTSSLLWLQCWALVRFSRATHHQFLLHAHTHCKRHSNIPSDYRCPNSARVKWSPHTHITLVPLLDQTQTRGATMCVCTCVRFCVYLSLYLQKNDC